MTDLIEMGVLAVIAVLLLAFLDRVTQDIVSSQRRTFGNIVDVDEAKGFVLCFAVLSALVSAERGCRYFG